MNRAKHLSLFRLTAPCTWISTSRCFSCTCSNPICTSLRALQQASELDKVQKKLGCARASLDSLSESARAFDSDLLKAIIEKLPDQLPNVSRIRDNAVFQEIQNNPLSEKAQSQGVLSDKIVTLGGETADTIPTPVRLIAIKCNPNTKCHHTVRGGPAAGDIQYRPGEPAYVRGVYRTTDEAWDCHQHGRSWACV
jgi:hypothetical protein